MDIHITTGHIILIITVHIITAIMMDIITVTIMVITIATTGITMAGGVRHTMLCVHRFQEEL